MRVRPSAVILLIFAFMLFACQPIAEQTDADVAAIQAVLAAWGVAVETGDAATLVALRTDDVVRMPPDEPVSKGKQDLKDFYSGLFEQFSVEGTWPVEGTEEIVVADGWAFHLSEFILRISSKAGGEAVEERGKIIAICQQQPDGSWKIAREIWNRNSPPFDMESILEKTDSSVDQNAEAQVLMDLSRQWSADLESGDLEAITALREENLAAINASDVSTLLTTFTDDVVFLPDDQPPVVGKAALEAWVRPIYEQYDFEIEGTVKEVVVAGNWAFEWGLLTGTFRLLAGGEDMQVDMKYVYVYERQPDGSWRCAYDIVNKNVPSVYPVPIQD
jgi:uncharacterized protein (TIGR02246 family)